MKSSRRLWRHKIKHFTCTLAYRQIILNLSYRALDKILGKVEDDLVSGLPSVLIVAVVMVSRALQLLN